MKFRHLGIAVPSIESALDIYRDLFGYKLLSGPYDDPIQKVSVCFLGTGESGDCTVELVSPYGENSPVKQMLSKGITTYHLCYEVENMEAALDLVKAKRCIVVCQPAPAVAFHGRRIAWFYTPNRQLVELVER